MLCLIQFATEALQNEQCNSALHDHTFQQWAVCYLQKNQKARDSSHVLPW